MSMSTLFDVYGGLLASWDDDSESVDRERKRSRLAEPYEGNEGEGAEDVERQNAREGFIKHDKTSQMIQAIKVGDVDTVHRLLCDDDGVDIDDGGDDDVEDYADTCRSRKLYKVTSTIGLRPHVYHPGKYEPAHFDYVSNSWARSSWSCCGSDPAADILGCWHRDIPLSIVITAIGMGKLDIAHDLLHSGAALVPNDCESVEVCLDTYLATATWSHFYGSDTVRYRRRRRHSYGLSVKANMRWLAWPTSQYVVVRSWWPFMGASRSSMCGIYQQWTVHLRLVSPCRSCHHQWPVEHSTATDIRQRWRTSWDTICSRLPPPHFLQM
jgi:hypothetical protein